MQILFIFLICSCTLLGLGLVYMGIKWQGIMRLKKQENAQQELYKNYIRLCYVGAAWLSLATFTLAMFAHVGEAILYLPLLPLVLGYVAVHVLHRKRTNLPSQSQMPHAKLWQAHFTNLSYTEKFAFAEKNTLEMQAFGNDMYMSQSHYTQGTYQDKSFTCYDLCLPDYFSGHGLTLHFPEAFGATIYVISKDFPCSQLLTYSGQWQKTSLGQEDFDANYTIFTKNPENITQILSPARCAALLDFAQKCQRAQSYYFSGQEVQIIWENEPEPHNIDSRIKSIQVLLGNL